MAFKRKTFSSLVKNRKPNYISIEQVKQYKDLLFKSRKTADQLANDLIIALMLIKPQYIEILNDLK